MGQDVIYTEAIERFGELFSRAADGPSHEPAAVTLATSDPELGAGQRTQLPTTRCGRLPSSQSQQGTIPGLTYMYVATW